MHNTTSKRFLYTYNILLDLLANALDNFKYIVELYSRLPQINVFVRSAIFTTTIAHNLLGFFLIQMIILELLEYFRI